MHDITEVNIRQRKDPQLSDPDYLHLSDLLIALKSVPIKPGLRVLDFGCGNSPYRSLFANSEFLRADFVDDDCDYKIDQHSAIAEQDAAFDVVLTTQVAEHVEFPDLYFAECYRLLKPGGTLILSTHGSFEDHAAPYDFQRWTAAGLRRDLKKAQFQEIEVSKLTTAGRALTYLLIKYCHTIPVSRLRILGLMYYLLGKFMTNFLCLVNRQADQVFPNNRIVKESEPNASFYICLVAVAKKASPARP